MTHVRTPSRARVMDPSPSIIQPEPEPLEQLLARPADQRLREYKYRCAQAIVFGLPVIGLQYLGPSIGGPEAPRWVAILQAALAGWVVYIGAAGMLFEGLLVLRWDLICPRCRGAKAVVTSLDQLPQGAHCPSCNIPFDRDFSRNVEVTFDPADDIRPPPGGTVSVDLIASIAAAGCYLFSFAIMVRHLIDSRWRSGPPLLFHVSVTILALWCGLRWWQLARAASSPNRAS